LGKEVLPVMAWTINLAIERSAGTERASLGDAGARFTWGAVVAIGSSWTSVTKRSSSSNEMSASSNETTAFESQSAWWFISWAWLTW
jgi:hypothetical protein